jgi:hypothetical protein
LHGKYTVRDGVGSLSGANDGSNERIRQRTKPFRAGQFHPEALLGPLDTGFLFDEFVERLQPRITLIDTNFFSDRAVKSRTTKSKLIDSKVLGYQISKSRYSRWRRKVRYSFYWRAAFGLFFGGLIGIPTDNLKVAVYSPIIASFGIVTAHACLFIPIHFGYRVSLSILVVWAGASLLYFVLTYYSNAWGGPSPYGFLACLLLALLIYLRGMYSHPKYYDDY